MKNILLRLIVTSIVLYGLGALAYGLLRYPPGEQPDVGGVLGDFTSDLGSIFRRKESERPVAPAPERGDPPGLEGVGDHLSLSLALSQIHIPDSGRLPAAAAEMWDALRPIHAEVLPEGIEALGRLRTLASTDRPAFERDRAAARARLAPARETLRPHTQGKAPLEAAVKLLAVLEQLDAQLASL